LGGGDVGTPPGSPRLCLIELYADRAAGHWGDNLVRLCEGATAAGFDPVAIAVQGIHPEVATALGRIGVRNIDRPSGGAARTLMWLSRRLRPLHSTMLRIAPDTHHPQQVRYWAKCLAEVSALRTVTRTFPDSTGAVVILTASQTLGATAAAWAGTPHVRYVHDVGVPEGWAVRISEWLMGKGEQMVVVACTTPAVEAGIRARHPGLRTAVRPFTVLDPKMYISSGERAPARRELGIGDEEFVVSMVGGWWAYKDVDVVERALGLVEHPVTLILAGNPIRPAQLEPAARSSGGRIVNLQGGRTEHELRRLYAASDCALVTRVAGFDREAATIHDAARYGVPLIATDHDPTMSRLLSQEDWVRLFPPGDQSALAATLLEVAARPLPRPDRDAAVRLGLSGAEETIATLWDLAQELPGGVPRRRVSNPQSA